MQNIADADFSLIFSSYYKMHEFCNYGCYTWSYVQAATRNEDE
jgi:hypothetical protein